MQSPPLAFISRFLDECGCHSRALVRFGCEVGWPPRPLCFGFLAVFCLLPPIAPQCRQFVGFLTRIESESSCCTNCLQMATSILDQEKSCGLDPQQVLALVRSSTFNALPGIYALVVIVAKLKTIDHNVGRDCPNVEFSGSQLDQAIHLVQ